MGRIFPHIPPNSFGRCCKNWTVFKHGQEHAGGRQMGRIFPGTIVGIVARLFVYHYEIKHTVVNYWVILLLTLECKTSSHTCR